VRSVTRECRSKLILFGEDSLRRAMSEFLKHCLPRTASMDYQALSMRRIVVWHTGHAAKLPEPMPVTRTDCKRQIAAIGTIGVSGAQGHIIGSSAGGRA